MPDRPARPDRLASDVPWSRANAAPVTPAPRRPRNPELYLTCAACGEPATHAYAVVDEVDGSLSSLEGAGRWSPSCLGCDDRDPRPIPGFLRVEGPLALVTADRERADAAGREAARVDTEAAAYRVESGAERAAREAAEAGPDEPTELSVLGAASAAALTDGQRVAIRRLLDDAREVGARVEASVGEHSGTVYLAQHTDDDTERWWIRRDGSVELAI